MLENGEKEVGIVKVDSINNDFSEAKDSAGENIDIYEGFAAISGAIIHGAWLSNPEGNLMLSDINLEDLSVRSEQDQKWYEDFIKIENGKLQNTLFMSFIIASGSKLTCLLQETEVDFKGYDAFSQFFPDIMLSRRNSIKFQEKETIVKSENPSDRAENKVSALQNLAFQISEKIQVGVGVPRIVMPTPVLNLQSKEQKYSEKLFEYLLESIKPKSGDALYDPSSPIFSVGDNLDKPQYNSQDPNYWVKMITRFTIEGNQKSLTNTKKKMFYNGLLLLIQNDLYIKVGENWVVNPDSAFIKHEYLLSESFTDNADFVKDETDANPDNWRDDFGLVKKLDIVLQDKFGLVGSASLISGFMTFSETSTGGIQIDFVPQTYDDQNVLNNQFDLHKFDSETILRSDSGTLSLFYSTLFINGFFHKLKGREVTQSGTVDVNIEQEIRPSTEAFLDDYFKVYNPRDSLDYKDATNLILEGYLSKVSDQKQKNKANLIGRQKLYEFLSKKAEDLLRKIFLPYKWVSIPYVGGQIFEQFTENPGYWYSRTLRQTRNFLRAYIEQPTSNRDFIGTLREILRTGKDGYIELKTSRAAGAAWFARTYGENALLEQGLKIPISYEDLVEFFSFDNLEDLSTDALFSLLFHYHGRNGKIMTPYGYSLDANQWWGLNKEEITYKSVKAYETILNAFKLENLGEALHEKDFRIEFLIDGGAGINSDEGFDTRFSRFGISDYIIKFNPSDSYGLQNAIASLITYLYAFPDTFAVIKQGNDNFLFTDIFNIHSPEYVAATDYSNPISGSFMWKEDGSDTGLTRENYDILAAEFSADDRFNDRDIRFLLGFDNEDIVGLILNNFQTMFREQLHENIFIRDLRIKIIQSNLGMFGDFPFMLNDYYESALIGDLIGQGIQVVESEVVAIVKNREDRIIWLTQGTERRGLIHILAHHGESAEPKRRFSTYFDMSDDSRTIGNFIFNAIKNYPFKKVPGGGQATLYIYEIRRSGDTNYLKIVVDEEGEIVTAYPDKYEN